MAYIQVDVDLEEFDTSDLLYEFRKRVKKWGRNQLGPNEIKEIQTAAKEFLAHVENKSGDGFRIKTLDDRIKYDAVESAWDRMSAAEFERRLA